MKEEIGTFIKTAAKSSAKIFFLSSISLFLGFLFNIILLVFCFPEMKSIASDLGPMPIARAGGIGAILALIVIVLELWPIVLLILGFAFGFPFLYFISVKKYLLGKELNHLVSENKTWFTNNISKTLSEMIKKRAGSERIENWSQFLTSKLKELPNFLQEKENWPKIIRFILQTFLKKIKIHEFVEEVAANVEQKDPADASVLEEIIKTSLNKAIDKQLEPSPPTFFYIVLGANFGIFLAIKFLI
ncbi:hypothetical protein [Leptospira sarikeiensis]|uniref:Uncharacterized protein n=1 Tax=Leptospira sarikeiensis TaxID=2484943 RepID=A0A4R9JZJ7_9LEPT|nr:hypothetical protein [Leptospira sarikeiensis]TGL57681.1 hypothetical protein EHQ64_20030 [Leptospira sarikeiensis]